MKCPKCQYISFDNGDRCRNCGYEFSLAADGGADTEPEAVDLRIQDGTEPLGPLSDFSLNDTPNLPLFTEGADRDTPLVTPRATPRAPLSVRRTGPAAPRPRARRDIAPAESWLTLDSADLTTPAEAVLEAPQPEALPVDDETPHGVASAGARLVGGLIDVALVAAIDLAVIYFTLRICDLTISDVEALPRAPLIAFLVMLNGGYLSAFVAASGQTIGKMIAGTRVVPADPAASPFERVSFGQSALRAAAYAFSALPLGAGFVPALIGRERRALHDRLADTRVVKA